MTVIRLHQEIWRIQSCAERRHASLSGLVIPDQAAAGEEGPEAAGVSGVPDGGLRQGRARGRAPDRLRSAGGVGFRGFREKNCNTPTDGYILVQAAV